MLPRAPCQQLLQVLPWVLMLPRGHPYVKADEQQKKMNACVGDFAFKTLTTACRRPLESWGIIEKLVESASCMPASTTPFPTAQECLLTDASKSAILPLFCMFHSALRRFRRADSNRKKNDHKSHSSAALDTAQTEDILIWKYVASAARLILPRSRYASVFAMGLLDVAVQELSASQRNNGPAMFTISWNSNTADPKAQGAYFELTISASRGCPNVFIHLLEWLWETASLDGESGPHCAQPPIALQSSQKEGRKRKRTRSCETQGNSVLIAGHVTTRLTVEVFLDSPQRSVSSIFSNEAMQGSSADVVAWPAFDPTAPLVLFPQQRQSFEAYSSLGADQVTQQSHKRHDEFMHMLALLHGCAHPPDASSSSRVNGAHVVEAFSAAAASVQNLPDVHLQLLMGSCIALLRRLLLRSSSTGRQHAGGTTPKRNKSSSAGSVGPVAQSVAGVANLSVETCALAVASAGCFEGYCRESGREQDDSPVAAAAWDLLRDVSASAESTAYALHHVWGQLALATVLICLRGCRLSYSADPRNPGLLHSVGAAQMKNDTHGQDASKGLIELLAEAASLGVNARSAASKAVLQLHVLESSVQAAANQEESAMGQLLAFMAKNTMMLLPHHTVATALASFFNYNQESSPAQELQPPEASMFAIAEACLRQNLCKGNATEVGQSLSTNLKQACALALKCLTNSSGHPAVTSFLSCFFGEKDEDMTNQDGLRPEAVHMIWTHPEIHLQEASLASPSPDSSIVSAACVQIAVSPKAALVAAQKLRLAMLPLKHEGSSTSLVDTITQHSRTLAAVLAAAQATQEKGLLKVAQEIAAAVRTPVLKLLVRPPTQIARCKGSSIDWHGVGQLALQCLMVQPLQVCRLRSSAYIAIADARESFL